MNPTERTMKRLRDEGWQVAVVERWMKHPNMAHGRRIDVWGFGDLLAVRPADERLPAVTALVQVTSGGAHWEHRQKLQGVPEDDTPKAQEAAAAIVKAIATWKAAGNVVWLISWSKNKYGWKAKEEQI